MRSLMSDVQDGNGENKIIKSIARNTIIDDKIKIEVLVAQSEFIRK